jgi:hypothetical protein
VQPSGGTPSTPIAFTQQGYAGRVDADAVPNKQGRWSVQFPIPEAGHSIFPATPGKYPVTALCYATEGAEAGTVSYNVGIFKVTAH